jgi:hypothetical protein
MGGTAGLKGSRTSADSPFSMDAAERKAILSRYIDHSRPQQPVDIP